MHMTKAKIVNYKSYLDSDEIKLSQGFTIIVGQNNVGKTALVEALSIRISSRPHHSLKTLPTRRFSVNPTSRIEFQILASREEILEYINEYTESFIRIDAGISQNYHNSYIDSIIQDINTIDCVYCDGIRSADFSSYKDTSLLSVGTVLKKEDNRLVSKGNTYSSLEIHRTIDYQIAADYINSIYMFKAERLNISTYGFSNNNILNQNADNLAQVLNKLQTNNPPRFQEYFKYVNKVFPQITQITIPPNPDNPSNVLIKIWSVEPSSARDDLAVSLAESGTGIGQVLAILYVVLTSDFPRTIIIDEPQSFLHPGAVRVLFDILRAFPQHQYIITTHSPIAISSSDPQRILFVTQQNNESKISQINSSKTEELRQVLLGVGARISDVFGADHILWVEGPTEEGCFPLIVSEIAGVRLFGTVILGVRETGDLVGKQARAAFEIYRNLSKANGLLPSAVAIILDRDGRTETQIDDLMRESDRLVTFLPRRMFENYLLNPPAISEVLSEEIRITSEMNQSDEVDLDPFPSEPVGVEEVESWIAEYGCLNKYGASKYKIDTVEWLQNVDAAKLLADLFIAKGDARLPYDKIRHGKMLTQWIIEHNTHDLDELGELLKTVLSRAD